MKENKYDDQHFFDKYSKMPRSVEGLNAAGEWYALKKMFPDFRGKKVLDLGCGFGWHCQYAAEKGAVSVVGIDISEKMLEQARQKTKYNQISYQCMAIEDFAFAEQSFDIIISSLALHYIASFAEVCQKIASALTLGGYFVFSLEHPIFTAEGTQDWYYGADGNRLHWPVDHYFSEGKRQAVFLGEPVIKYHRTLTTYLKGLIENGLRIVNVVEAEPQPEMLKKYPEFQDETRRPMMLLIAAQKA